MAIPKLFALARMTTSTTGTGTITLGSAATVNSVTYLTFANAGVSDGDIVAYGIADTNASEYGYGTYTASGTTLTRNPIRSTNSNNAISLSGSAQVFITAGGSDLPFPTLGEARNFSLAASVGSSALTIAIKDTYGNDPSALSPVYLDFRSATAATGTTSAYALRSATSLVISSGSTLGTANNVPFRIWIVAFDDAGTIRIGAIQNVTGGATPTAVFGLAEYAVASSTAEGGAGAADNPATFYTGTAVTSKAYRIIGFMEWSSGLATAGTWSAGPTTIQVFGPGIKKPNDAVQVGRVLKIDTFTSSTSGALTDITGLTVSITPSSAANLIVVDARVAYWTDNQAVALVLLRGSTNINGGTASSNRVSSFAGVTRTTDGNSQVSASTLALDAPGTTSSTTYKVQFILQSGGNIYVNRTITDSDIAGVGRFSSGITVTEIMT